MFYLANNITLSRIVMTFVLLLLKPLEWPFWAIYLACGISDVVDGYVARKTQKVSELGSKLDSLADIFFIFVVVFKLYDIFYLPSYMIYIGFFVLGIRLLSWTVVFLKYRVFCMLHTYLNKGTGLLLFLLPLAFESLNILLAIVAILSALEELFIHIFSTKLSIHKKSIFL